MDGVYGMEGNGPRSGTCRKMNVLLLSADPIALDATVCRLINLDPELVPTIRYGEQFGCGTAQEEQIRLLGDPFSALFCKDFKVDRRLTYKYVSGSGSRLAKVMIAINKTKLGNRLIDSLFVSKPALEPSKCVRCGVCIQICPTVPKSIDWIDGDKSRAPRHDHRRCIRCFCCQETCPEGAIFVKTPPLRNLLVGY